MMMDMLFDRRPPHNAADMLMGMAAGAAIGAAGAMLAGQNQRQMKRTAHKMAKGAEHAVMKLDKMVSDFVDEHK